MGALGPVGGCTSVCEVCWGWLSLAFLGMVLDLAIFVGCKA